MRVPGATSNPMGSIRGVTGWYDAAELAAAALALDGRGGAPVGSSGGPAGGGSGIPLGAQVMGSSPELMGLAAQYLAEVREREEGGEGEGEGGGAGEGGATPGAGAVGVVGVGARPAEVWQVYGT